MSDTLVFSSCNRESFFADAYVCKDQDAGHKANMIIWAMEQTAYDNWFIFHYDEYAKRIRSLATFIKCNPQRFLKIDPAYAVTMEDRELSDYQEPVDKKEFEAFMEGDVFSGESEVTCRKCKQNRVSTFWKQTRSGDERKISNIFSNVLAQHLPYSTSARIQNAKRDGSAEITHHFVLKASRNTT